MAHGELIERAPNRYSGGNIYAALMLDSVAAPNDGVWLDVRFFRNMSVELVGAFTGTIQMRGSNASSKPEDTEHGTQIGDDITAPGFVVVQMPVRWIKCRASALGAGAVSATLHAVT